MHDGKLELVAGERAGPRGGTSDLDQEESNTRRSMRSVGLDRTGYPCSD